MVDVLNPVFAWARTVEIAGRSATLAHHLHLLDNGWIHIGIMAPGCLYIVVIGAGDAGPNPEAIAQMTELRRAGHNAIAIKTVDDCITQITRHIARGRVTFIQRGRKH